MKAGSERELSRPMELPGVARSWEEVRFCWQQMSGEDISRQAIQQIGLGAIHKIRAILERDVLLRKELKEYL